RPNEVYAWDITKLHGPQKWTYQYLYTVIDIYSRYVVGWMVADRERSETDATCARIVHQPARANNRPIPAGKGGRRSGLSWPHTNF
ncbi:MAG: DDE-type integrase/transposase/recombinase, partial [Candidatus Eremiobacteraeota bacterium]|nr:DDE-type integrase/transposase/recombinase [Candidatus Eremiobacteraeota bacterium]